MQKQKRFNIYLYIFSFVVHSPRTNLCPRMDMQWAPSSRKSTKMLINPDRFLECGGCLFSFTRARVNCKYAHWIGGWSPRCMCTHLWRKRCRRHWHCFTFTILMWNRFVWCQFRSNNESRFDFFYLILKSSTRFPHSTTPLNLVMVSFAEVPELAY